MTLTLTPEEREKFIREARREFVAGMMATAREDFDLLSISQAAGLLDMNVNTLRGVPGLDRVEIIPGKVVKYRRSQILAFLEKQALRQK